MAKKKRRYARNYETAIKRAERLAAKGSAGSEEFEEAAERATQLFLEQHGCSRFNMDHGNSPEICKTRRIYKWLTVADLYKIMNGELDVLEQDFLSIVETEDWE